MLMNPTTKIQNQHLSDHISEKLAELLFSLDEPAERGNIFFVATDYQRLRFRLEGVVRERLSGKATVHVLRVDKDHLNIPRIIHESSYSNRDVIFIFGIERRDFRDHILQYLNFGREFLSECKSPLVFWTTPRMVADISDSARDLWAFRGGVFEFQERDFFDEGAPMSLPELLQIIEQAAKDREESLDLSGRGLTELPPEIGQLTHLTELHLSGNQLTGLPSQIGQLNQLIWLFLNGNQLTVLPSEIGQLTHLTGLDLSGNQLTALPSEIGQLTHLAKLNLSDNQLTVLPSEIGRLNQLIWLYLGGNQLTQLPPEIGQLTHLMKLDLQYNHLIALPPEIDRLPYLMELDLRYNRLTSPLSIVSDSELIVPGSSLSGSLRSFAESLRTLTQREFTNAFQREQHRPESHCPNVFVLRPRHTKEWLSRILDQKIDLQLYCQAPGFWHPTQKGGLYPIDEPAAWLDVMAPYIEKMVSVLKSVEPLVGLWIHKPARDYEALIKRDIHLMEELAKRLPDMVVPPDRRFRETLEPEHLERAALRALRALLDEVDPQHQWGGLKKVLTPEGHYLWLCEYHASAYVQ